MRLATRTALPLAGLALAAALWATATRLLAEGTPILAHFAPLEALRALQRLVIDPLMWEGNPPGK